MSDSSSSPSQPPHLISLQRTTADTLRAEIRAAMAPPVRMSVPTWADTYRVLPREAARAAGPWRTSRVEIARGPMLAVTEPGVHIISAMTCTQLLKTDLLLSIVGFKAHLEPGPILLLQPKDDAAEQFSKERLTPMIRATPALRGLIGSSRMRSGDETIFYKPFPGGFVALAGAGSPDNVARRPVATVLADEVDKYTVSREGDPLVLADERLATFGAEALSVRACSPTIEDESRIARSYSESDQRRASVECPGCGHRQFLEWKHVDWQKRTNEAGETVEHLTKTARIHCESCGEAWSEAHRLGALQTARWHQTRPFECCGVRQRPLEAYERAWRAADGEAEEASSEGEEPEVVARASDPVDTSWDWWEDRDEGRHAVYRAKCCECGKWPVDNTHAGFHASKLYSPWERDRPAEIAAKWIAAKGFPDRELAWWNTQMGLPHRPSAGRQIAVANLLARRELWDAEVPDGVGIMTAGVDVQDYRVEVEVVGWGRDEESWSIDHHIILGEMKDPSTQLELDAYLLRRFKRGDGREQTLAAVCIDSGGHHTQAVYSFSKARLGRRIWAIKGASEPGGTRNPVWPVKKPVSRLKSTFKPIILGGNTARDVVRARLAADEQPAPGVAAPGYCHFPVDRDLAYFEQLTADRLVVKEAGGRRYRVWETPSGRANEASDMRVYAYAALCGLVHTLGLQLNRLIDARRADNPDAPPPAAPAADVTPPPRGPPPAPPKASSSMSAKMLSRFA